MREAQRHATSGVLGPVDGPLDHERALQGRPASSSSPSCRCAMPRLPSVIATRGAQARRRLELSRALLGHAGSLKFPDCCCTAPRLRSVRGSGRWRRRKPAGARGPIATTLTPLHGAVQRVRAPGKGQTGAWRATPGGCGLLLVREAPVEVQPVRRAGALGGNLPSVCSARAPPQRRALLARQRRRTSHRCVF